MLFAGGEMERTGYRMMGMKGRIYNLWWSGDGVGGVGVMVKEMCKKVVEEG